MNYHARMNIGVYPLVKRLIDVSIAACFLVITAPLIGLFYCLSRMTMGAPVLYRQQRPGLGGRLFTMYKFRTMSFAKDPSGALLSDSDRLTWVGRIMRKTSIDELPQLFNVLRGDMSLIGPRPLLKEYLPHYTPEHMRRHLVRPGITGWAQVYGRNNLLFSKRLDLDIYYVNNISFLLDLKIFVLTALRVLRSSDVRCDQDVKEVDDLGLSRDLTDESFAPHGGTPAPSTISGKAVGEESLSQ